MSHPTLKYEIKCPHCDITNDGLMSLEGPDEGESFPDPDKEAVDGRKRISFCDQCGKFSVLVNEEGDTGRIVSRKPNAEELEDMLYDVSILKVILSHFFRRL